MDRAFRKLWFLPALTLLLVLNRPPRASAEELGSYREWIDRALMASDANDWAGAYEAFARAHAAAASARALRGMGVVSYRMGRYAQALSLLQQALREPGMPLDDELRMQVLKLVDQLSPRLGRCVVAVNAQRPRFTLDGAPALIDEAGRLLIDPGPHAVGVEAEGYVARSIAIQVAAGAISHLEVDLSVVAPSPSPAAPEPSIAPASAQTSASAAPAAHALGAGSQPLAVEHRSLHSSRVVTLVAAATIPVFALGTGMAWYRTQQIGDDLAERCRQEPCSAAQRHAAIEASPLSTFETLTNVGLALTMVSAVATCVSFALEEDQAKPKARVGLSPLGARWTMGF